MTPTPFDYTAAAVHYATAEDQNNRNMSEAIRQRLFEGNKRAYVAGAQRGIERRQLTPGRRGAGAAASVGLRTVFSDYRSAAGA